jgi:hypothetical protein
MIEAFQLRASLKAARRKAAAWYKSDAEFNSLVAQFTQSSPNELGDRAREKMHR